MSGKRTLHHLSSPLGSIDPCATCVITAGNHLICIILLLCNQFFLNCVIMRVGESPLLDVISWRCVAVCSTTNRLVCYCVSVDYFLHSFNNMLQTIYVPFERMECVIVKRMFQLYVFLIAPLKVRNMSFLTETRLAIT